MYRTEVPALGFTDRFDPVGETSPLAIGLYSQLLLRTLVTYRHVAGVAGTKIVPDIATDTGQVSSDGLTWTFTLKEGVHYAPPLNRSVTAEDVAFAFRRIDTASLRTQFGMWFDGLIVGMDGPRDAPAPISGIQTPNDRTIVFHLRHPAGDFPDRLALPAVAPVPPEVAGCYKHAGWYGRTLVASGPYMIEGEDQLEQPFSSCRGLDHPVPGIDLARHLRLIRNPNYDPSTDSPDVRSNFLDGVDIEIQANPARILHDVSTGRIDGMLSDPFYPNGNVGRAVRAPNVRVQEFSGMGGLRYLFMNLLVPPFDDVHVRRAVEYALDRSTLLAAAGGPISRSPATHLFRWPLLNPGDNYDPYPHSLAAAKTEMARSHYDHNHDGLCDDAVCRNLVFIPCIYPHAYLNMLPLLQEEFASIGVMLESRELGGEVGCLETPATPKNLLSVGFTPGWTPDFPDPSGLALRLSSAAISCEGQTNFSEVGMTRVQMDRCGLPRDFVSYPDQHRIPIQLPPSVNADLATCENLQFVVRNSCWDAFDHHVMEDIVPWVPLYWTPNTVVITGRTVVPETVTVDQFSGLISLCHLAVRYSPPPT